MSIRVQSEVNYIAPSALRPRYYANDHSRDVLTLDPRRIEITDARLSSDAPQLDREGFILVDALSMIRDFAAANADSRYRDETAALIGRLTGADAVVINAPGVLRFGERSPMSGQLNNSRPARFVHVDISDATAADFGARSAPAGRIARVAHYNIWRSFSGAPQDVPLAVCDARSVAAADLLEADAIFDVPGQPEWSFVGLVIAANPAHRWHYFSAMTPGEALVFKTNDTDAAAAHCVPHSAFNDPSVPPDTHPRSSIEMRAIAYWFA